MDTIDLASLLLRLWLGSVMMSHGIRHARTLDSTAAWFRSKGFRRPHLNAAASAVGEIAIGLGMMLGLLTSLSAAGLVATMAIAYWSIHRFSGFFVFARPDEGWEYVATLATASVVVGILGPGDLSLDALAGLDRVMAGWTGLLISVAGIPLAALQLALFWRGSRSGQADG